LKASVKVKSIEAKNEEDRNRSKRA
jgi:hypothetical protein